MTFLKQLGIKNDFLAKRVFAGVTPDPIQITPSPRRLTPMYLSPLNEVWPEVLSKDVDLDLRPIMSFLKQLGMEVTDLAGEIPTTM